MNFLFSFKDSLGINNYLKEILISNYNLENQFYTNVCLGVAGGPRKQHACTYCTYSANRKSNLTLHIESVHLKIKYSCPACQLQESYL